MQWVKALLGRGWSGVQDRAAAMAERGGRAILKESIRAVLQGGRLLTSGDTDFAGRIFFANHQRRHWVPSEKHLQFYGLQQSSVETVPAKALRQYRPACPLPLCYDDRAWATPPRDHPSWLREVATSKLHGIGIEFGAGNNPMPVPLDCKVLYADYRPRPALIEACYSGIADDFVDLDYVLSLEDLHSLDGDSMDFLIACHVIEHLPNPLRALHEASRVLKPAGTLVLVVPDKRLTFDKDRELTRLEHLIEDYEKPLRERDIWHYLEFYSKAFVTPVESLYEMTLQAYTTEGDVHYHTWTFETFCEVVEYSRKNVFPWRGVWAQPPSAHLDANEFYYVLTK